MKVIAVGNTFCGDDGVGAAVLAQLGAVWPAGAADRPELIDLGTDALALIDQMEPGGRCVVVDAARMGLPPGEVAVFRPEEARLRIRGDGLSLHGLGLAEAFGLAAHLGRMPQDLLVIGVEPAHVDLGSGLSDVVAAAVPRVVGLIQAEVLRHE